MANGYPSQQHEHSWSTAWFRVVVAVAPLTWLVTGLGMGAAGYLLQQSALAAGGALAGGIGLAVERGRARALRRRRHAERMRSRDEVTELRRTIAQLREEVDAFQRALLDTEAALAAWALPVQPVATPAAPAAPAASRPTASPVPAGRLARATDEEPLVVALAQAEAADWVQTPARDAAGDVPLPARRIRSFVPALTAS